MVKRRTAASRSAGQSGGSPSGAGSTGIGRSAEQHQTLSQKLRGHFAYYGITGNGEALHRFRDAVTRALAEMAVAPHAAAVLFRGTASTGC